MQVVASDNISPVRPVESTPAQMDTDVAVIDDAKYRARVRADSNLQQQLITPLVSEPMEYLIGCGFEGLSIKTMLQVVRIGICIEATDRLVCIDSGRFMYHTQGKALVKSSTADLIGGRSVGLLESVVGELFDKKSPLLDSGEFTGEEKDRAKVIKIAHAKVHDVLTRYVQAHRFVSGGFKIEVDMFMEGSPLLTVENQVGVFTSGFDIRQLKGRLDSAACLRSKEITEDFRHHFPPFDDFIQILCAARFAPDRRKAFLWLQCEPGWGKSFLLAALSRLDLSVEVSVKEIEKALEGSPSGLSPENMAQAWVLAVDEFKTVKSEIKQLNNEISLSPKHRSTCTVPVYLKLFLSAENVDSLVGEQGAEAQFVDRFSYMRGEGRLADRTLFKEIGAHQYRDGVACGIAEAVAAYVEDMRDMGKGEAYRVAEAQLDALHRQYGLANTHRSLDESLQGIADDLRELVRLAAAYNRTSTYHPKVEALPRDTRALLLSSVSTVWMGAERQEAAIMKSPGVFVKRWLNFKLDRSEAVKVGHKSQAICRLATDRSLSDSFRVSLNPNDRSTGVVRGLIVHKIPEVSFF